MSEVGSLLANWPAHRCHRETEQNASLYNLDSVFDPRKKKRKNNTRGDDDDHPNARTVSVFHFNGRGRYRRWSVHAIASRRKDLESGIRSSKRSPALESRERNGNQFCYFVTKRLTPPVPGEKYWPTGDESFAVSGPE